MKSFIPGLLILAACSNPSVVAKPNTPSKASSSLPSLPAKTEQTRYEITFTLAVRTTEGVVEYPINFPLKIVVPTGSSWACVTRPARISDDGATMAAGFTCSSTEGQDLVGTAAVCFTDQLDEDVKSMSFTTDDSENTYFQVLAGCKTIVLDK